MANTTNYNWETPDDTDLVKDGAAAIRTLGNSIDTTTKNLNPETTTGDIAYRSATANTNTRLAIGTTGQVLTVAAGVPSWATPTDQTPLTTKGDVFTFSTVDARLGVGANGTVLTADSAETTGLKWVAPAAGGGLTLLETLALSGSSTTSATISGSYVNLLLVVKNVYGSAQSQFDVRFNGDTGNNYYQRRFRNVNGTVSATTAAAASRFTDFLTFDTSSTAYNTANAVFRVFRYTDTDITYIETTGTSLETDYRSMTGQFLYDNAAAITSVTFLTSAGTFSGGTVYIYGEK